MTSLLAMQKVVGSNPISRFFENAVHMGGLGSTGKSRINWNHARISASFQELVCVIEVERVLGTVRES
jgi:hypothetical protein